MKTVLVSGASGIVGYGILKSLRSSGKKLLLVGTSIYEDSAAQGFCEVFEKAVPTDSDNYISWLVEVLKKHSVDIIIPGIEADLYKWVEHREEIEQTGVIILLNNLELLRLCKDKWNFYQHLVKYNSINTINTSLSTDFDSLVSNFGLPFLLKPRRGFGSKGIVRVENRELFLKFQHQIGSVLLAQPIVGNEEEEYTTSAFCDGQGSFFSGMTLKRKLSKDGFTEKAEVVFDEEISDAVKGLCKIFKPIGPTNFQFRKHEGVYKLLEINPRISSATSIRTAFGYNESLMAVEYYLENKLPERPNLRMGKAVRYVEDMIYYI